LSVAVAGGSDDVTSHFSPASASAAALAARNSASLAETKTLVESGFRLEKD